MEFEIKSFMEVNLIVDAVLLLAFSFTVLLRNPKFLIFIVILNLCQYVVWVPDQEVLAAHKKLQEQAEKEKNLQIKQAEPQLSGEELARNLGSGNPVQMAGQATQIYDQVLQGMGGGTNSASSSLEVSMDAWKKSLYDSEKENGEDFSLDISSVVIQAARGDMHAAWFMARLFWLAATFYLYVQRPQIGSSIFALNLLPIPFFANFAPYLWYRFNEQQWVKDLNLWAQLGTMPKETGNLLFMYGILFVALTVPLFVVAVAGKTQWSRVKDSGLRSYLDPTRFDLMINGSRIPFKVNNNELLAEDFCLNIKQLSYDPDNPHIWYLKTGTKVEFVEK